MSDRCSHQGVATLVGFGIGCYAARDVEGWPTFARILGAVLASVAGASLPDVLEPPVHSWHRRFFHSLGALLGSAAVTIRPPLVVQQWLKEREAAGARWRTQREALPQGHADRARLWVSEMLEHFVVGAAFGLPAGYASHLILDAGSPRGLPPV